MVDYLEQIFADLPLMLQPQRVAELLNVRPQTVYGWLQNGDLVGYKVGGSWVIPTQALRDYLEENANAAAQRSIQPPQTDE